MNVNQILNLSATPAVLTDTFPNKETNMVFRDPASSNSILMLSSAKSKSDVMVATRNKD